MSDPEKLDDDNRTIADMSGVERPSMFGHLPSFLQRQKDKENEGKKQPLIDMELSPQQKRWYILGAISATLLVGLCYAVGLGLIIFLMLMFW